VAQEIGVAYVTVAPSGRGFGKTLEGEIDQGVTDGTKKADSTIGKFAKGVVKWGAIAIGGIATAVTALSLKGGIDRALNIEDARAKLKGLGHDVQTIDEIMVNALASVKGTAFGLDAAATTAATAVAAGIKPGQELEKDLRLTADAATIAGTSLTEMGAILNKTTTAGKVYTQELNQLADRGLPVFQWLQDEYGVTAQELRKMVAAGEVDAATFRRVIEENIGGAALASGDTTRGAFANMGAALSRLGVTVVQPFVDNAKGLFNELTAIIDGLNARIGPFAEQFAQWFNATIVPSLDGLNERVLANVDSIVNALDVFRSALRGESADGEFDGILGALNNLGANINANGIVAGIILSIGEAFQDAADWLADGGIQILVDGFIAGRERMVEALVKIVPGVVDALQELIPALAELVIQIVNAIVALAPEIVSTLVSLIPAIVDTASTVFIAIVDGLVVVIPALVDALLGVLPTLVQTLMSMIPTLVQAAIDVFMALVNGLIVVLPQVIETVMAMLPDLVQTLLEMVPQLITAAIELFNALIDGVLLVLPDLLLTFTEDVLPDILETLIEMMPDLQQAAIDLFTALINGLVEVLPPLLETLIGEVLPALIEALIDQIPLLVENSTVMFMALVDGLIEVMPALLAGLVEVIAALVVGIVNAAPQILLAAVQMFMGFREGLDNAFPAIKEWLMELPGKIIDAIGNVKELLVDTGKNLLDGLGDGIRSNFEKVKNVLGELTNLIPSWKGPAERDRVLLTDSGRMVMDSLVTGFKDGEGAVKRYLTGLTDDLAATASIALGASITAPDSAALTASLSDAQIAQLVDALARAVRTGARLSLDELASTLTLAGEQGGTV